MIEPQFQTDVVGHRDTALGMFLPSMSIMSQLRSKDSFMEKQYVQMKTHWLIPGRAGGVGGGYQDRSMTAFISHKYNNDSWQTPRNPEQA